MRISDWSSDVCSSDLALLRREQEAGLVELRLQPLEEIHQLCLAGRLAAVGLELGRRRGVAGEEPGMADQQHRLGEVQRGEGGIERHRERRVGERDVVRSEEHTSEIQSIMRISYAV